MEHRISRFLVVHQINTENCSSDVRHFWRYCTRNIEANFVLGQCIFMNKTAYNVETWMWTAVCVTSFSFQRFAWMHSLQRLTFHSAENRSRALCSSCQLLYYITCLRPSTVHKFWIVAYIFIASAANKNAALCFISKVSENIRSWDNLRET
jgi:hypothetical protein